MSQSCEGTPTPQLENVIEIKPGGDEKTEWLLETLQEYPKFQSTVAISASLPTVERVLLFENIPGAEEKLLDIIDSWKNPRVTIRSENRGGKLRSPSIKGCPVDLVWDNMVRLLEEGKGNFRLVMAEDSGDILHNFYSGNIMIPDLTDPTRAVLELCGPGFIATNVSRDGIWQERLTLPLGPLSQNLVLPLGQASEQRYQEQVEQWMSDLEKNFDFSREDLEREGALILGAQSGYKPIPFLLLAQIHRSFGGIEQAVGLLGLKDERVVASFSFLANYNNKLVFWDIHQADSRQMKSFRQER